MSKDVAVIRHACSCNTPISTRTSRARLVLDIGNSLNGYAIGLADGPGFCPPMRCRFGAASFVETVASGGRDRPGTARRRLAAGSWRPCAARPPAAPRLSGDAPRGRPGGLVLQQDEAVIHHGLSIELEGDVSEVGEERLATAGPDDDREDH